MKRRNNEIKDINKRNIIQREDLKNLDDFIQKCLDNFKLVEPKKNLYEATGEDKDLIISHKSTIPDLVIWNKTFNKNNCFIGANTSIQNEFPRFLFYIKIKKNKKPKNKINLKSNNKTDSSNEFNINFFEKNNNNNEKKEEKNSKKDQNKNNSNVNKNIKKNNINDIGNEKNIKYKINEEKNKFSINRNTNMNEIINNLDNSNMINLTIYLIQLYMDKNGWIILTKDEHFSGPGTSIDLYQFLQEKINSNINLNEFIVIDINKQVKYLGNYFFMILLNILPNFIHKKQFEFIEFEKLMNKQFPIQKSIIDGIHKNNYINNSNMLKSNNYNIFNSGNNNFINNNNLNNNHLFSGIHNFQNTQNFFNGINQINNYNITNINQYLFINNNSNNSNILNNKDNYINFNNNNKNLQDIENNNLKNKENESLK